MKFVWAIIALFLAAGGVIDALKGIDQFVKGLSLVAFTVSTLGFTTIFFELIGG